MAKRITVVISQSQSKSPVRRELEENLVAGLLGERGIDVTVIPNLYDLKPDGTGMLCLQGITGDMVLATWLYPRAAHWVLDRNGIHGHVGQTLIKALGEDEEEDEAPDENEGDKPRVVDQREIPNRKIYCLDLRAHNTAEPYLQEILRIARETTTQTVSLMDWIDGKPRQTQLDRYLSGTETNGAEEQKSSGPIKLSAAQPAADEAAAAPPAAPTIIEEEPDRRWYPVIDYSRCTNCMECIDFCLFGVYGVDRVDTILVEQPDNCRKGCPACSRVCPENAIIFPQHKTPTIAGSREKSGGIKIDLSELFGAPDAIATAAHERDEQLILAGRDAVGLSIGIPKRQADQPSQPKDELDSLMDQLDEMEL